MVFRELGPKSGQGAMNINFEITNLVQKWSWVAA